ncbi:MAG: hypothetical protein J5769_04460 [Bacteroidales bacterium]|nr:hypothetical protein [Bacteroidales bacterium]
MKKQCTLLPSAREYTPPLCELFTVHMEHSFLASGDPNPDYTIPEVEEEDEDWN